MIIDVIIKLYEIIDLNKILKFFFNDIIYVDMANMLKYLGVYNNLRIIQDRTKKYARPHF